MDPSISSGWGRVPVYGSGLEELRAATWHNDRIPGRVRRTRDWTCAGFGHLGEAGERLWTRLYAHSAVFVELPRSGCANVGVFRRCAEPSRPCHVLSDVPVQSQRRGPLSPNVGGETTSIDHRGHEFFD